MKITTPSDNQKIKCLLSGLSGSGKTWQARKLIEHGYKPLFASMESGELSLNGVDIPMIDLTKDEAGNVIPKENRVNNLMNFYNFVLKPENMAKYDTLYIDSLTEISQCLFDYLRKQIPDNKDNLVLYGLLSQKTRDVIKSFRDINHYNVVFTCLSEIEKDANGQRFPALSVIGAIDKKLPSFFDLCIYVRPKGEDKKREFICNATDTITAKDRSGKLEIVEEADIGMIFDKVLNKQKEEKAK